MIVYTIRKGFRIIGRTSNYIDAYMLWSGTKGARMTSREVRA